MNGHDDDELAPAEQRPRARRALVREDARRARALIVSRAVRSARWKRAIRRPLAAIRTPTAIGGHALRPLLKPPAGHP